MLNTKDKYRLERVILNLTCNGCKKTNISHGNYNALPKYEEKKNNKAFMYFVVCRWYIYSILFFNHTAYNARFRRQCKKRRRKIRSIVCLVLFCFIHYAWMWLPWHAFTSIYRVHTLRWTIIIIYWSRAGAHPPASHFASHSMEPMLWINRDLIETLRVNCSCK